jgi:cell division protein ZapA
VSTEQSSKKVNVHILGKEYQIVCPSEEEAGLTLAAQHLDKQMRTIRDGGKVIGLERIAIMTALNLSHELLQAQAKAASSASSEQQNQQMHEKIDSALQRFKQLEL